jgi:hypothetical protein
VDGFADDEEFGSSQYLLECVAGKQFPLLIAELHFADFGWWRFIVGLLGFLAIVEQRC